jgi:hypothetical protein
MATRRRTSDGRTRTCNVLAAMRSKSPPLPPMISMRAVSNSRPCWELRLVGQWG